MMWKMRRYVTKEKFEELKRKLRSYEIFESAKYIKLRHGEIEYILRK